MSKHNDHGAGNANKPSKGKESHTRTTKKGDRRGGGSNKGGGRNE